MGDFLPPSGPPPPHVPEGWKAQWNDQYKEWFYVNVYTRQSQWEKPTEPVYPSSGSSAPAGPPPSYGQHDAKSTGPEKGGYGSNNPYGHGAGMSEDERLARKLQEEENARLGGSSSRGAAGGYYGAGGAGANPQGVSYGQPSYGQSPYGQSQSPMPQSSYQQQEELPARDQKRGLFSKLMGKSSSHPPQQSGYPQQQATYGQGGYGYPQQQAGYYGQQPQYVQQQQAQRKHGLGAGGGAALGLGGGLLGGMMLGEMMGDMGDGGDGGGDYGGGDGGGDFGGGDGGGDMGGGDF